MSASHVRKALVESFRDIEKICDVRFVTGGRLLIHVSNRPDINGRAWYDGKQIAINSAIRQSTNLRFSYVFWSHEIGHWAGFGHSSDKKSIMYAGAGSNAIWTPANIRTWLRKYGKSRIQTDEPSNAALARDMAAAGKRLQKDKALKRQQGVTVQAVLVVLRQLQAKYGLKK